MTNGGIGMHPLTQQSVVAGGDCAVLRIAGEVEAYTAPRLREHVIDLIDNGVRHLVADLRAVTFLDSTGLAALIGSLKRLRVHGGAPALGVGGGRGLRVPRPGSRFRVPAVRSPGHASQPALASRRGR